MMPSRFFRRKEMTLSTSSQSQGSLRTRAPCHSKIVTTKLSAASLTTHYEAAFDARCPDCNVDLSLAPNLSRTYLTSTPQPAS